MGRTIRIAALALALVPAPALAGVGAGDGEFGFDFGVTRFDSNVSDNRGERFALRGGYHFTKHFELEGQYAASDVTEIFAGVQRAVTLSTLSVGGLFGFPSRSGHVVPYLLAGAGVANLRFRASGSSDNDSGVAYQAAGGCRFFFGSGRRVAARVEALALRESTFGQASKHESLVVGLTWRLGGAP